MSQASEIAPSRDGELVPLQYSCLENPMDGGAWWAVFHGVAMSWTRLSDFTFTFHFHALEEEMVTHSRILAWRIPGTGEPGGLPSMGSHRVRHDWSDLAAAAVAAVLLLDSKETYHQYRPMKTTTSNESPKGFPGGSMVKKLRGKREMRVWSLGRENSLEKEMATHSSILTWEIPRTEEPVRLQPMGSQRSQTWLSD